MHKRGGHRSALSNGRHEVPFEVSTWTINTVYLSDIFLKYFCLEQCTCMYLNKVHVNDLTLIIQTFENSIHSTV